MVRGIVDGKFKPYRVLSLSLEMKDCKIDSKEFGELLANMTNLNSLVID